MRIEPSNFLKNNKSLSFEIKSIEKLIDELNQHAIEFEEEFNKLIPVMYACAIEEDLPDVSFNLVTFKQEILTKYVISKSIFSEYSTTSTEYSSAFFKNGFFIQLYFLNFCNNYIGIQIELAECNFVKSMEFLRDYYAKDSKTLSLELPNLHLSVENHQLRKFLGHNNKEYMVTGYEDMLEKVKSPEYICNLVDKQFRFEKAKDVTQTLKRYAMTTEYYTSSVCAVTYAANKLRSSFHASQIPEGLEEDFVPIVKLNWSELNYKELIHSLFLLSMYFEDCASKKQNSQQACLTLAIAGILKDMQDLKTIFTESGGNLDEAQQSYESYKQILQKEALAFSYPKVKLG